MKHFYLRTKLSDSGNGAKKPKVRMVCRLLMIAMMGLIVFTGCGKKEETLNILGYDDEPEGYVVRPYNELTTAFQISNHVKVNFEIISSEEMSYENFLLKAASDLNVGKVDLVMGYGTGLAQLPKSKADLSEVYKRHPEIMKGFQYDFMVPMDSFFWVDAYDAKFLAKKNQLTWNHEKEKQVILEDLASKGKTITFAMYQEYIKAMTYNKLIVFEDGKYIINEPEFEKTSDEMKALRDSAGNIDEYGLFKQPGGGKESLIGTPKKLLVNGLNLRDILTTTSQFKSIIESPADNRYPNVLGIYVRKNSELTDRFIDYMLSEAVIQKRLDWHDRICGRITVLTDEQLKEKATYYGLDASYAESYKGIQTYVNSITAPTREEMLAFGMQWKIKKGIFLTCQDETEFADFKNSLVKQLDAMSAKTKMIR